jgi:hypothetical protein
VADYLNSIAPLSGLACTRRMAKRLSSRGMEEVYRRTELNSKHSFKKGACCLLPISRYVFILFYTLSFQQ